MSQPYGQPMTVVQAPQARPSSYLILSIFTCICCGCLLGIIAIVFSALSSSAADEGDFEKARSRGRIAKWLSIIAIILGVVIIIFAVVINVIAYLTIKKRMEECAHLKDHDQAYQQCL